MSWDSIYGQERIIKILQRAQSEDKIAGAYLFSGPKGVGKEAIAFQFFKSLNNIQDASNFFNHPNFHLITPLPTGKGKNEESSIAALSEDQLKDIQDQLWQKSKDPYHKLSIKDANQIKISQIRDIKKSLMLSQSRQGRTIVIISDAHLMTNEASNAFLKTIEEPHPNTSIILITENLEMVLQTIRSRCQIIKFPPLSDQEIIEFLNKRNLNDLNHDLILPFAKGSISRIEEYLNENFDELHYTVISLLRIALKKNVYRLDLINAIDQIVAQKNKKLIENILLLLGIWFNDALKLKYSYPKIINTSEKDSLERLVNNFPKANYPMILKQIDESIKEIYKNVNPNLVLITLFTNLRNSVY